MASRRLRRLLTLGAAGALTISGAVLPAVGASAAPTSPSAPTAPSAPPSPSGLGGGEDGPLTSTTPVRVIVMLRDQPSGPSATAEKRNIADQGRLLSSWSDTYDLTVDRQFGYLLNGFSATIPENRIQDLALEPEVASVRRERIYETNEFSARELEGVPSAFQDHGVDGTGMLISIIDSGVDTSHQDMRLDDCHSRDTKVHQINTRGNFTCKIPDGYDYADEDWDVREPGTESHGMHVAGIVAANGAKGDESPDPVEDGRIDGVAPNAQLLFMKVFPDASEGAQDSDIIAAIEDSVKKHADVINMSLGSPNGQKDASDGAYRAIAAAHDAGVLTVVAAGNDGQNFSATGIDDDAVGVIDDGTLGTPGSQASAFTVASVDNAKIARTSAVWNDGTDHAIGYDLASGTADGKDHPIVDVGLGRPDDYTADQDLSGSYALIERGEIAFSEKYQNALDHHAEGVIIFNDATNGDAPFGMAGIEEFDNFGATLSHTDGAALQKGLAANADTTIRFTTDRIVLASDTAGQPSSFTSWGTTPTLDFEPEIAGIGGSVYSTLNDDTYGTMSGTSMASPNVAGLSALVLEEYAERFPDASPSERLDLATTALMNTATPVTSANGVLAAPRQIGAGLANVDHALDSRVLATVDGDSSVALREVGTTSTFTVDLANHGTKAATFRVPQQDVLKESQGTGPTTMSVSTKESLTSPRGTVTVKPGQTAQVTYTLRADTSAGPHFIEGWALLESTDKTQPDLRIPYLGFVGDWNQEEIVSAPGEQMLPGVDGTETQLATVFGGQTVAMSMPSAEEGGEATTFALSPNGDGDMDVVAPMLAMKRNAYEVQYEIRTPAGKLVTKLGTDQDVARTIVGDWLASEAPAANLVTGRSFDGGVWDPQKKQFVAVPDGDYVYTVKSRLGPDSPWQSTELPFTVDGTAPVVRFGELEGPEKTTLPLTVLDEGTGPLAPPDVATADGRSLTAVPVKDGDHAEKGIYEYTIDLSGADDVSAVTASVVDAGMTLGVATTVLTGSTLVLSDGEDLDGSVVGPNSPLMNGDDLLVQGYVSDDVTTVTVGSQEVEVENGRFTVPVPMTEGKNTVSVTAQDAGGHTVDSSSFTVTYDATAPELSVEPATSDDDGAAVIGEDGTISLSGTVADERAGAELSVTVDGEKATVQDGRFTAEVTPEEDQSTIAVIASDGVNSTTSTVLISGRSSVEDSWTLPEFTNADCMLDIGACYVDGPTPDANEDGSTFTLKGKITSPTDSIEFTPGNRATDDGGWTDPAPIPADIAEDGTFTVTLPVSTGENHFRVQITDDEGTMRVDRGVALFFDVTAPTIHFKKPTLIGGTLFTNQDTVQFQGSAEDDGWGYTLSLNGSTAADVFYYSGLGPESNARTFDENVDVADGDQILIQFSDANGNAMEGRIPVVVDKTKPEVSLGKVRQGQRIDDGRTLTAKATDTNLASLKVSVDDEVVDSKVSGVAGTEAPVEDELELQTAGAAEGEDAEADSADDAPAAADEDGAPADDQSGDDQAGEDRSGEDSSADEATTGQQGADGAEAEDSAKDSTPTVLRTATTKAASADTTLTSSIDTSALEAGDHKVSVESTDLAGNRTAETVTFTVVDKVTINGPKSVNLSMHREDLRDQKALTKAVLKEFSLSSTGSTDDVELKLAKGTTFHPGKNVVDVIAEKGKKTLAQRTVTVNVDLKSVTLRDGSVSVRGTFRSDDAITASRQKRGDGSTVLTVANRDAFAAIQASISLPAAQGTTVRRILPDGRQLPVKSSWKDGRISFLGSSKGRYLLLAPASGSDHPGSSDPGSGGSGVTDPGRPDDYGTDEPGSRDAGGPSDGDAGTSANGAAGGSDAPSGTAAGDRGPGTTSAVGEGQAGWYAPGGPTDHMARTGTDAAGYALAALVLIGGGVLALRERRRLRG